MLEAVVDDLLVELVGEDDEVMAASDLGQLLEVSRVRPAAVGLLGETIASSFVRSLIRSLTSVAEIWKSFSSIVGIPTGTPPASRMFVS